MFQRFTSLFIIFLIIVFSPLTSIAQTAPYRLSTSGEDRNFESPAQSFRLEKNRQNLGSDSRQMGAGSNGNSSAGMMMQGSDMGTSALMGIGYQVHVLGEVSQPGTYHMPASSRLAEAIDIAGGLTDNASERTIELRRRDSNEKTVDLLRFKLFGSLNDNPYLMDNDVIFVPLRSTVIRVVGAVKRPDTYELNKEENLKAVLELAGGFNPAVAIKESIRVIRYEDSEKKVKEISIDDKSLEEFAVQSGDVVVVPNLITKETTFDYNVASIPGDTVFYPSYEDRVFVLGGVASPGAYSFSPYYTVNQYISLSGGLTDRGTDSYKIIGLDGKRKKGKESDKVNPGDTIMIKQRWMAPSAWISFMLGIASFGLSTTATVLALTR